MGAVRRRCPMTSGETSSPTLSVMQVDNAKLVTTYRWLDKYGQLRKVAIFLGPAPEREVEAYAIPVDDAEGEPVLVARLDERGKFTRLQRSEAIAYGLDTAAAWNNLYDLCRSAHGHRTGPYQPASNP